MNAPIGIFDSGVGGLSVALEIRRHLPAEDLLYFADSAFCPYGGLSLELVRERSLMAVAELVRRGAKVVVVACNTASGAALELLRATFAVPIVGLEPAVKPAAARSAAGRIGVMATAGTLRSERFRRLVENHAAHVQVVAQACTGLVELVEAGHADGDEPIRQLRALLAPMLAAEVDTVVLGCTHYPFLRSAVSAVMGPDVALVDSGEAVARQVRRVLDASGAAAEESGPAAFQLLTTGQPRSVGLVAQRLWGAAVPVVGVDLEPDVLKVLDPHSQVEITGAAPSASSVT